MTLMDEKENGTEQENPLTEFHAGSDRRGKSPGRRIKPVADRDRCQMHDELRELDKRCLDIIKKKATIQDSRLDKFSDRLETFVSKWVAGIITTVACSLLGVVVTVGFLQLSNDRRNTTKQIINVAAAVEKMSKGVLSIENSSGISAVKQTRIATIQENVVKTIDEIKRTQNDLHGQIQSIKYDLRSVTECNGREKIGVFESGP